MNRHQAITRIGKAARKISRLRGGSGSALPGLIIEKLDPNYLVTALDSLPHGVVVITGTNGKTTTTKMVVHMLRDQGLKVFTNQTGSNFVRGVIASSLTQMDSDGIVDADIAILELDEAYATHFVKKIPPKYCLLLNVMRDQLDRFGEIDHTAKLLEKVAVATTDGVVLNRDDQLVRALSEKISKQTHVRYFGLSEKLRKKFPSDQEMYGTHQPHTVSLPQIRSSDVILDSIKGSSAIFAFGTKPQPSTKLKLTGLYNMQNAAGALSLVRMIMDKDLSTETLLQSLSEVKPAFGRGEAIEIDGQPLEIILVKNPAGFRLALSSYGSKPATTMIAINDNYADGRDMSWLWDVDFSMLDKVAVVSGIRAYDMTLRLQYDDIEIGLVSTNLASALRSLLQDDGPKRIYCTYTAMMQLRTILEKSYDIGAIDA